MQTISQDELLKRNTIELAKNHREYGCRGQECNISLSLLLELLTRAKIEISADERKFFL